MVLIPLRDNPPARHFPFVTILLVAANFLVFFIELTTPNIDRFILTYSLIPSKVNFGDFYTLIPFFTSLFLHAGWLHLIGNVWFLWIFGDNVEGVFGRINYLIFYLATGFLASFVQYLMMPNSPLPVLGASGAIAGTLGAYFFLFPKAKVENLLPIGLPIVIDLPAYAVLFIWFIVQVIASAVTVVQGTMASGGVAYWAHIGGFFAGITFAWMGQWFGERRNLITPRVGRRKVLK
ncbi:MAG: rhomboid family intramembrane serine protease [Patescibacteria group bacterium]|nr:rhomboid family intramembrane serine protease [Patescibacteria group bacterium]